MQLTGATAVEASVDLPMVVSAKFGENYSKIYAKIKDKAVLSTIFDKGSYVDQQTCKPGQVYMARLAAED